MPLDFDQVSAITEKFYVKKMYDNIFDSNPGLMRFKKNCYDKVDGGTAYVVPLNYAQMSNSGWFSGAETFDISDNQNITAASYAWCQAQATISIRRDEELKNSGDKQILDLVKNKTKIAEKSLMDKLATGIYSDGSDAKAFVGLRDIVATAETVGGISQSTYSWWRGQVDSSTTTLTLAALGTQYQNASIGSDTPSVCLTTRTIWELYHALLQPQERFQDAKTADAGFQSLMFRGAPVLADSYCSSGHWFFVNETYIHLAAHRQEDMRFEPFQKPLNQNVSVAHVYFMGTFGSSNNRMHAKLSAITA